MAYVNRTTNLLQSASLKNPFFSKYLIKPSNKIFKKGKSLYFLETKNLTFVSKKTQNVTCFSNRQIVAKEIYAPADASVTNTDKNDYFISSFFLVLRKVLNIKKFETIHFWALNFILDHFINFQHPELFDKINFKSSYVVATMRNFAKIKKSYEEDVQTNKRIVNYIGNNPMLLADFDKCLQTSIENNAKLYYLIYQTLSIQLRAIDYHNLYINLIVYVDSTECKELGDNINKDSGPGIIIFLEACCKRISCAKVFPSKKQVKKENEEKFKNTPLNKVKVITSETIVEVYNKEIIENPTIPDPVVLHSDSDNKNKSMLYFNNLRKSLTIPSLNKTPFGGMSHPHHNQQIEITNRHFKSKYVVLALKNRGLRPGDALNFSLKVKQEIVNEAVELYNAEELSSLSTKYYDPKNGLSISPNQSKKDHSNFHFLFTLYLLNKTITIVPKNIYLIENLDLENPNDQNLFISYFINVSLISNILLNKFNSIHLLSELNHKDKKTQSAFNEFKTWFSILFAYAISTSQNEKLKKFFKDSEKMTDSLGEAGPGRKKILTEPFKLLLQTKESMHIYTKMQEDILCKILEQLRNCYENIQNNSLTQVILTKTDLQTETLIQHAEKQSNETQSKINKLSGTIESLNKKLQFFYEKEQKAAILRNKRKNRKQNPLTAPIKLNQFIEALNLTDNKNSKSLNEARQFANARNRIALYILYFTGTRIGAIREISYNQLIDHFSENEKIYLPVAKKRDKKAEHIFSVSKSVRNLYVYGLYNIWNDFKYVLEYFNNWANKAGISEKERYDYKFFSGAKNCQQVISREYLTDSINTIIRKAVENVDKKKKNIESYSSKSFRVNVTTSLMELYGIRAAQFHMKHANISTTVLYDRSTFPVKNIQDMTNYLGFDKTPKKIHPDLKSFSQDQIKNLANYISSNPDLPVSNTNLTASQIVTNKDFLPQLFDETNTSKIDKIEELNDNAAFNDGLREYQIENTIIDLKKSEKSLKRAEHIKKNI